MYRKRIIERLNLLEQKEKNAVCVLNDQIDFEDKYISDRKDPKKLVRCYQCINENGLMNLFDENIDGCWGNASDDVPLLRQLLMEPRLIVDLKNIKNDESCFKLYGVTIKQLILLARLGFISINVYAYESGKKNGFNYYTENLESEDFIDLLDYDNAKCRINSIRKEGFFNRLLTNNKIKYSQLVDEYYEMVKKVFVSLSSVERENLIKNNIIRDSDIDGNIETIAQQISYIKSSLNALYMNNDSSRAKQIEVIFNNAINTFENKNDFDKNLLTIRGLKNCIATPFTASMGGTYNMSSGALKALYYVLGVTGTNVCKQEEKINKLDKHTIAILEYIERVGLEVYNSSIKSQFTAPLSTKEFMSYIDLLKDCKNSTTKLNRCIENLSTMTHSKYYDKITEGKNYFDIEKEIINEYKKANICAMLLNSGFSGILAKIPGFIALSLRGFVTGESKKIAENILVEDLITDDQARIMTNLSHIQKIVGARI